MTQLPKNEIVITGAGCVLPGASNLSQYWDRICEGIPLYRDLPSDRWNATLYFSANKSDSSKTYSRLAAIVEDAELKKIAAEFQQDFFSLPRSHWMVLGALTQALKNFPTEQWKEKKIAIVLGCMSADESISFTTFYRAKGKLIENLSSEYKKEFEEAFSKIKPNNQFEPRRYFTTSVLDTIQTHLGIKCTAFLVDAACASSLAAIDTARQMLLNSEVDLIISGGFESNLTPESFLPFARLGVLAQTKSLPFDAASEGIVQGEGAVIYTMERLEDALPSGRKIMGVIRGCGGSSNGAGSSLVSPSIEGQSKAYLRAIEGLTDLAPSYIEGHGTGTPLGDGTELEFLTQAFSNSLQPIPVGSVKSILGHTKGAAGAAGLLKSILILHHKLIPASAHVSNPIFPLQNTKLFFPRNSIPIVPKDTPIRISICSSGFGGSNYHLVLENWVTQSKLQPAVEIRSTPPLLLWEKEYQVKDLSRLMQYRSLKIPPKLLKNVEPIQLAALYAINEILERNLIYDTQNIFLVSASHHGTDQMYGLTLAMRSNEILEFIPEQLRDYVKQWQLQNCNFDSEVWAMHNSITTGRISSEINSAAKNLHIDAGYQSKIPALTIAKREIASGKVDYAIVLDIHEDPIDPPFDVKRSGVNVLLLGRDQKFAQNPSKEENKANLIFSGQGSAYPGMLSEFANHPIFRKFFKIADAVAKEKGIPPISAYSVCPSRLSPKQEARVRNPALYTAQVVIAHLLVNQGYQLAALTGHSFGEYAALTVSGTLPFELGLQLVLMRDLACGPENSEGYMLAIALESNKLTNLLSEFKFFISNINSDHQTVVSTDWESLIEIESVLKANHIAFKRLNLPHPYHSPLLNSAKGIVSAEVSNGTIRNLLREGLHAPIIPVFSSVTQNWLNTHAELNSEVEEILKEQLTRPIDFPLQCMALLKFTNHIIEVGPNSLLSKVIEQNTNLKCKSALDILRNFENTNSKNNVRRPISAYTLELVNSVLAKVTGYQIEDIRLEDKLQDDLGVDSIKATEIIFQVMDELAVPKQYSPLASISTVEDLALLVEQNSHHWNYEQELQANEYSEFKRYLETWLENPLPYTEAQKYKIAEALFIETNANEMSDELEKQFAKLADLSISNRSNTKTALVLKVKEGAASLPHLDPNHFIALQSQFKKTKNSLLISIVTDNHPPAIVQAYSSFFKSLKKENLIRFFTQINLIDPPTPSFWKSKSIAELNLGLDSAVEYRGEVRFVKKLVPIPLETANSNIDTGINADSSIVAIGGAKGITFSLLKRLVQEFSCSVHIIGRSSSAEVSQQLEILKATCPRIYYHQADASLENELIPVLQRINIVERKIDLVINGAGSQSSQSFLQKTKEEIAHEMKNKIDPAINLIKASRLLPIKRIVFFSSVIARFGNHGQSIYGFANSYMESLTKLENTDTQIKSIQWPPWKNIGMTTTPFIEQQLRNSGVELLDEVTAYDLFKLDLADNKTDKSIIWNLKDYPIYTTSLVADSITIGNSIPQFNNRITFSLKENSDHLLIDHRIQNQCLLPAAAVICMAYTTVRNALQVIPQFRNFTIWRPVKLSERETLIQIQLTSKREFSILQFEADFPFASLEIDNNKTQFPKWKKDLVSATEKRFEAKTLYGSDRLFHGQSLQVLSEVEFKTGGNYSAKVIPANDVEFLRPFGNWIPIIDAAFQLLGFVGQENFKFKGLPFSVASIEFYADSITPKERKIELSEVIQGEDTIIGDLLVTDWAANRPLLKLKGALLRRISD